MYDCTMLIFSSGKMVITGEKEMENIKSSIESLRSKLNI